jgi:hypothetical protein
MASKVFTEAEMDDLRACPYVLDVSQNIVHFSAEFKELFWNALQEGKRPRDIVIGLGVDPDILGENRVNGLKGMIKGEVKAGKGFRDLKTYNKDFKEYNDPEATIKFLERRLAYKDQEIEFLKKVVILGMEDSES